MDLRAMEVLTGLFIKEFNPVEWMLNPVTMYFEHKTRCLEGMDISGKPIKIPFMLSAKTAKAITHG